jgi:thiamine-phosphate diphosphorylase
VREQLGVHVLIGRSVHDLAGAVAAAKAGVDYLIVGTVFATASKPGREPAGLSLLREVTAAVDVPVIAIGGINVGNARRVIAAGAWGVAVMSGILAAPKPAQAVVDLLACLEEGEADD